MMAQTGAVSLSLSLFRSVWFVLLLWAFCQRHHHHHQSRHDSRICLLFALLVVFVVIYCCNSSKSEQTSRRRSCRTMSRLMRRALPFPINWNFCIALFVVLSTTMRFFLLIPLAVATVATGNGGVRVGRVPPPKIVHKTLGRGGCPWNIYSSSGK